MIGLVNEEMTEFLFKLIVEDELLINELVSSNLNKALRFNLSFLHSFLILISCDFFTHLILS